MTKDQIDEFLQAAQSIIISLDDLGEPFLPHEELEFVSNEEAAQRSHPDNAMEFLEKLREFGKIGTLTVSYSNPLPIFMLGFFVSGYQTSDGAKKSFEDLKSEFPQAKPIDLAPDLGDDRIGRETSSSFILRFLRAQFINSMVMTFAPSVSRKQSLHNLRAFARLMDARTAQSLGLSYPPSEKPEWSLPTVEPRTMSLFMMKESILDPVKQMDRPSRQVDTLDANVLEIGTRFNPVPFTTRKDLICEKTKLLQLSIIDTRRGKAAEIQFRATGQFLTTPPEGMECILLHIDVNYLFGTEDELLTLNKHDFRLVSNRRVIDPIPVVEPHAQFKLSYFQGGSGSGWMAWHVYVDDPCPLLVIGMDRHGRGGIYFATQSCSM